MAGIFREYSPSDIAMSFKGIPLLGVMDGTFVTVERAEDGFSMGVGSTGDVTRVRNLNKSGSITVTLQQSSPTNELLSAFMVQDELFGASYGPLFVKNVNGSDLVIAKIAWIRKAPNMEFAKELSGREWVFDCAELIVSVGSALT